MHALDVAGASWGDGWTCWRNGWWDEDSEGEEDAEGLGTWCGSRGPVDAVAAGWRAWMVTAGAAGVMLWRWMAECWQRDAEREETQRKKKKKEDSCADGERFRWASAGGVNRRGSGGLWSLESERDCCGC